MKLLLLILFVSFISCQSKKQTPIPWKLSTFKKLNDTPLFLPEYLSSYCNPIIVKGYNGNQQARYDTPINGIHGGQEVNYYSNPTATVFSQKNEWPLMFPQNSLIIKEKLHDEGNEYGAMLKRERGFDPENGDWEYFYIERDGKVHRGKLQNCIDCHRKASNSTFVYGYNTFR